MPGGVLMSVDASVQRSSSHATTTSTHLFKYTSSLPADGLNQSSQPPTGPTGNHRYPPDLAQRPYSPRRVPQRRLLTPFGNISRMFRELFGSFSWKPRRIEPPSLVTIRRWWITTERPRLQGVHWSPTVLLYLTVSLNSFCIKFF